MMFDLQVLRDKVIQSIKLCTRTQSKSYDAEENPFILLCAADSLMMKYFSFRQFKIPIQMTENAMILNSWTQEENWSQQDPKLYPKKL